MSNVAAYEEFFRSLTGRTPYAYQTRVAANLEESTDHVLLTAPTGCGKTWATIAPFLHARAIGRPFADRLVYALPLRALASSLKVATEKALRNVLPSVRVTIQTGAEPEDETFDTGDIVFATIDQILASYLHLPLSLPRRLANLNAGVLVGSLVVFDEAHLLAPREALRTVFHLLESHGLLARFVIATATLTTHARTKLMGTFGMVEEGPSAAEVADVPILAERRRYWTRLDQPISAEAVHARHRGGRTLVVVNSVRKAQEIAKGLLADPPDGARVLVLHSRFFAHDRQRTERELADIFGPDAPSSNAILVATQVVEAGIDISADVLMTEAAPGNALIQRAGRCARYIAPRNMGDVVVFDLERDSRGSRRLGPYRDELASTALNRAWGALEGRTHHRLDGDGECQLLEESMADGETAVFSTALSQEAVGQRREEVRRAWSQGDLGDLRRLVRDVQSVPVLLCDDPERIDIQASPECLSLPTPSWRGFLGEADSAGRLSQIRMLVEEPEDESEAGDRWQWRTMQTKGDWADLYALPSGLATYDDRFGLLLEPSTGPLPAVRYRARRSRARLHFVFETYRDHVTRALRQAREWLGRHPTALGRLAARLGVSRDMIASAVLLAAGLHDVAKLDVRWQAAAWAWQVDKGGRPRQDFFLAHTDFDPKIDKHRESESRYRRPPHSVESAAASLALVDAWIEALGCTDPEAGSAILRSVLTAIAQHHSARARNCGKFCLCEGAWTEVVAPMLDPSAGGLPRPAAFTTDPSDGALLQDEGLLRPEMRRDERVWPLYCFVVRGLRLSDQIATREGAASAVPTAPGEKT